MADDPRLPARLPPASVLSYDKETGLRLDLRRHTSSRRKHQLELRAQRWAELLNDAAEQLRAALKAAVWRLRDQEDAPRRAALTHNWR